MTEKTKSILAFIFMAAGLIFLGAWATPPDPTPPHFVPTPPKLEYTDARTGVLEVAKVFGRSQGCSEANPELIAEVSQAALRAGVDPRLMAAVVAVESGCNLYAISNRGAVGLMQINVKVWKSKYDFSGSSNLLNVQTNLQIGASILADLIYQYGTREGVGRYLGTGSSDGNVTPNRYSETVLRLAGIHG